MRAGSGSIDEIGGNRPIGGQLRNLVSHERPILFPGPGRQTCGTIGLWVIHVVTADVISSIVAFGPGILTVVVMLHLKAHDQHVRMPEARIIKGRRSSD